MRGPDVVNSCQLAERGPVVLAFFATLSERCERQVDVLERVRRRFPTSPSRRCRCAATAAT